MIRDLKKRAAWIVAALEKEYPQARCTLDYRSAHELLVATILSAQTTDEKVNAVTPALFAKYQSIEAFAAADLKALESSIRSLGLFRTKAKAIKAASGQILHHFGGQVPRTLEELTQLPGVGRKSGSVVLGAWYGKAEGIVVDTHVKRLARLLGLSRQSDPTKIEKDLMPVIAPESWIKFSHLLISYGRAVCLARRPRCAGCVLSRQCPSSQVGGA